MTIKEWRDDLIDECEIPLWKFLRITHYYTERVGIYVACGGDGWKPGDRDFWLTEDAFKGIRKGQYVAELERLLKYYANVPVWNVCAEWMHTDLTATGNGRGAVVCLTARCHMKDIREALAQEKADRRREKRREYARKRRAKEHEQMDTQ